MCSEKTQVCYNFRYAIAVIELIIGQLNYMYNCELSMAFTTQNRYMYRYVRSCAPRNIYVSDPRCYAFMH